MSSAVSIKRFVCCFILLVFALSITPKRYLHTLFASHTDNKSPHAEGPFQLSVSGYNCDNDDTVADSVFTGAISPPDHSLPSHYQEYLPIRVLLFTSGKVFHSLRGPPVC